MFNTKQTLQYMYYTSQDIVVCGFISIPFSFLLNSNTHSL